MRIAATSLLVGVLALDGCKDEPAKAPPAQASEPLTTVPIMDHAADGKRVVGELKQRLVGRLTEALKAGPASAIAVCNTDAPAIAASVARDGVTVGRATRKPRNPANLAAGWQAEALAQFEQQVAAGDTLDGATWLRLRPGGGAFYAEPLVIMPLCVTCHGDADGLAPDVKDVLAARYPADQATGYAPGDLRGVVWVEWPAPAAP